MRLPLPRLVLAVLAIATLGVGIDNMERPLANPDEGRYSEISREMAQTGDFVTPRLNGIKYFEKPPLQYWATALAFRAFGENEYTARLYVGLAGAATLLLVALIAFRFWGVNAALASGLALVCSPYFMALGGIVTLDMGVSLWTTATLFAFLMAEASAEPRVQRRWMLAAWVAMALAMLSKGLIGIVFAGAAVFCVMVLRRDLSVLRRLHWVTGAVIFLAIAAPWFVLVSRTNPEFAEFFFVHEHFARFLTKTHRRVEPFWYFIPIVLAGFLPWMFALPAAIRHAWRSEAGATFQPLRVCLIWSGLIVAFFSLSGSKLPAYVLPVFPPLALAMGRYLSEAPERRLALWSALFIPVALVLLYMGWRVPDDAKDAWTRALYVQAQPMAVAAASALVAGSAIATFLMLRARRWAALVVIAFASVAVIECGENAYEKLTPRQSGMDLAQKIAPLLGPGTRLYFVGHYEQTVPFYLRRTIDMFDYQDEFELGQKNEARYALRTLDQFPPEWLRPGDALAIMQPGVYENLERQSLPMHVLYADPKRVLVRKPS